MAGGEGLEPLADQLHPLRLKTGAKPMHKAAGLGAERIIEDENPLRLGICGLHSFSRRHWWKSRALFRRPDLAVTFFVSVQQYRKCAEEAGEVC